MAEKMTLDQLAGVPMGGTINAESVESVNIAEFQDNTPAPDTPATNEFLKEAYDSIDDGIIRYTNEIKEEVLEMKEKAEEAGVDEDASIDEISEISSNKKEEPVNTKDEDLEDEEEEKEIMMKDDDEVDVSSSSVIVDDDDFADLDDEDEPDDNGIDAETLYNEYKESIRNNINVINSEDMIDLTKFKKGKEISSVRALDATNRTVSVIADHVLYTTGKPITMESLDSDEIVQFNPRIIQNMFNRASRNIKNGADSDTEEIIATVNSFRQYGALFRCIYKHVVDDNKPDYNTWLKSINWADIEDLIFAAFKATYGVISNKITLNCENDKCGHIFIQEADVKDMIEFKNDECRERYNTIMSLPTGQVLPSNPIVKQVSRDYVFTFKAPTLYTMVVEATGVNINILKKYNSLFSIYQYVDKIEFIDREAGELREVKFNKFADINKTVKSKLKVISDILKTMTIDQRQAILAATSELDRDSEDMHYVMPQTECEKCHTVIEKAGVSAADLLFTRFQLIAHLS